MSRPLPPRSPSLAGALLLLCAAARPASAQEPSLPLRVLTDTLAVCPLPPEGSIPHWAELGPGFVFLTQTPTERSVVVTERRVPEDALARCERGWRPVRVAGALPLNLVGVVSRMTRPLAEAGISLFAISTHETDYVLVKAADVPRAVEAWRAAGHRVSEVP
jgi:hypothetical protein